MWPFKARASPKRTVPIVPWAGGGPAGGDAFWSWGTLGGGALSPQAAEALSAVASCVSIISETIGALPAVVTLADDSRAVQPNHPLSRLAVEGTNANESWSDLVTSLVASALLRGNGLAEIATDARGQLAALTTVPFEQCTPWLDAQGDLLFDYMPTTPPNAGQRRRLLRGDVVLLKSRSDNGVLGVSPLQRSANAVQHALKTQTNSFQWMSNASRPSGVLTSPGRLSKETAQRLKEDFDTGYTGERLGKTAVLPEGLKWEAIGWLTSEEAQIVERLAYSVRDVARIFGVPIFLLADETRTTFASASAALSYFSANTLRPWVARLERSFQQSVLMPSERLVIDLTALLKADPDAFAAALLKMRMGGYLTPNEARAMLGLPAHATGDDITAPSVMSGANDGSTKPPPEEPNATPPPTSKMNGHAHA